MPYAVGYPSKYRCPGLFIAFSIDLWEVVVAYFTVMFQGEHTINSRIGILCIADFGTAGHY